MYVDEHEERKKSMRKRGLIFTTTFLVTILWLHPTWYGWGQSQPVLTLQSESAVLMDGITGQILFEKNPEKRFAPASLAKMMTLYLAFDAIKRGDVRFEEEVVVSKKAWKMGGSQMFLEVGDRVKFIELIKGAATISANDGALAIAEFLRGSEEVYVQQMNEKARAFGLNHTHFVNPHGLPREGQYTCAIDMATLGFRYINDYPEALKFHTPPTFTYGGIKQKNWNPLLNRGKGVDGLKTGYLRKSGYHILFSAKEDGRRLVGVVMGGKTADDRNSDAMKLIGYGFKNFSTRTVVEEGEIVGKVKVPNGDPPVLGLSAAKTLIVTIRKDMEESIRLSKEIPSSVDPPITQGNIIGRLVLEGGGIPRQEIDLIASQDVRVKSHAAYYILVLVVVVGLFGFVFWRRRGVRKKRQ